MIRLLLLALTVGATFQFGFQLGGSPTGQLGVGLGNLGSGVPPPANSGVVCPDPTATGASGTLEFYRCANDLDGDGSNNASWVNGATIDAGATWESVAGAISDSWSETSNGPSVVENCIGSNWCVRGNGTTQWMTTDGTTSTYSFLHNGNDFSCYIISKPVAAVTGYYLTTNNSSVGVGWNYNLNPATQINTRMSIGSGYLTNFSSTGGPLTGGDWHFHAITNEYAASGDDVQMFFDGVKDGGANYPSDPTTVAGSAYVLHILSRQTGANTLGTDLFAMFCFSSAAHTTVEQGAIQDLFESFFSQSFPF